MTDVQKLTQRKVGISCANMSCGYYNPHTEHEIIVVKDTLNTKDMVYDILSSLTKRYDHVPAEPTYVSYKNTGSSYYNPYKSWDDWYTPKATTQITTDADYGDGAYFALDWYTDVPENADLVDMTFEDIYDHALLIMSGWEYRGAKMYKLEEGDIIHYNTLGKIDMHTVEAGLPDCATDEALEFADYVMGYKDSVATDERSCISCGKQVTEQESRSYDGLCYKCFSDMNVPIW